MKTYFYIAAGLITLFVLAIISYRICSPLLSEEQAFKMIYGNYDSANKSSKWINIPFPDKEDADGYFKERKGVVRAVFFQPYTENNANKIFLLTKTIPTIIPFSCHACLPLIGAAIFVKKRSHWEIEAQNQFIMYDGEYGELPIAKLIEIGKNKFGLSLEFTHVAMANRELNIIVPYKNNIINAHKEIIYYENFSECEFSKEIPCEAYTTDVSFDKSIQGDFYGLRVKKFGTIYNDIRKKMMPVDQKISYQLINGSYTMVRQVGENYILSTP